MQRQRPTPYTPPLTIKPLPALPMPTFSEPSPISSRPLASRANLKRARAVGRRQLLTRSADLDIELRAQAKNPSPSDNAPSYPSPTPLRSALRQRSYSFDGAYSPSPSPQSASDVVDWYLNNCADSDPEFDPEPESASEYEKTPHSARPPLVVVPRAPVPMLVPAITNVKSAATAFVSARRQPEHAGHNNNAGKTLGHALFGVRHHSVNVQVEALPSGSSADTTPSTSPRNKDIPLAGGGRLLAVPRRESTFLSDVSDSDVDVEDAFEQVAALLRTRNKPMLVEEKGYRRKAEVFVAGAAAEGRWI